jgi:hypothetical protein
MIAVFVLGVTKMGWLDAQRSLARIESHSIAVQAAVAQHPASCDPLMPARVLPKPSSVRAGAGFALPATFASGTD